MQGFEFFCPTKIVCGAHALDKLPGELESRGVTHPLVMTDAGLVKLGVAAKLTDVLDAAGVAYEVFDQVPPDSSMDVVNEVARLYTERGCDGFVAIGGGSVIDTTKGAAASLACEGVDFATLQGSEILKADLPPLIAVPTTAGTGSEVTLVAVVADTHKHAKLSFTSYKLVPHAAATGSWPSAAARSSTPQRARPPRLPARAWTSPRCRARRSSTPTCRHSSPCPRRPAPAAR